MRKKSSIIKSKTISSITIEKYLDKAIRFWRNKLKNSKTEKDKLMAIHYVDAFQSVRVSILGSLYEEKL